MTIKEIIKKYSNKLDRLDIELILAHSLDKTREFVLIHDEKQVTSNQSLVISKLIKRRIKGEPIAYLIGHKEFYGLDFIVSKHTLVPRPETEMLVDCVAHSLQLTDNQNVSIIDIGTGSGCIITSIAKTLQQTVNHKLTTRNFYATDISKEALKLAKKNAKLHGIEKKIKFLHGNLLSPFFPEFTKLQAKKLMPKKLIIVANLPYLSKKIYQSAPIDVKKYEPKSALYSPEQGLQYYRKLLAQIKNRLKKFSALGITCFFEISPEQKNPLTKIIKDIFPNAKIEFEKDLAKKWRVCRIEMN